MKVNNHNLSLKSKGIYFIVNNITLDLYVGSALNSFTERFSKHKSSYKS